MEKHKDEPFYLNIWAHVAHSPVEPHESLVRRFCDVTVDRNDFGYWSQKKFDYAEKLGDTLDNGMRHYLADLWGMDYQIGRVMEKLKELGLDDKTVIVFTSDHGAAPVMPHAQSKPTRMMGVSGGLRGEKHSFYEGGVRVPYIVRYPGHVPAGKVNYKSVISALDFLPTVARVARAQHFPRMFEGENMKDVWFGSDRSRRDPLFWRFSRTNGDVAVLYGKWKLYVSKKGDRTLYNLEADREERNNLYETKLDIRQGLDDILSKWESTLPKHYCRLDNRYEKCYGILPFDPEVPPVSVGPPLNVKFSQVSLRSAGTLAPNSIVFTPSPTPTKEGKRSESTAVCAEYEPTSLAPTLAPSSQAATIENIDVSPKSPDIDIYKFDNKLPEWMRPPKPSPAPVLSSIASEMEEEGTRDVPSPTSPNVLQEGRRQPKASPTASPISTSLNLKPSSSSESLSLDDSHKYVPASMSAEAEEEVRRVFPEPNLPSASSASGAFVASSSRRATLYLGLLSGSIFVATFV